MGKSTLIKLIVGLLTPNSGEITVDGKKIGVESKKKISYLPERTYLDKTMKIEETIEFFDEFYDKCVGVRSEYYFSIFDEDHFV